jgi:probable O-glycosylation ligase (exosortase A-associated)
MSHEGHRQNSSQSEREGEAPTALLAEGATQAPTIDWWRPDVAAHAAERATTPDSAVSFWALMGFTFILLLSPQTIVPALAPLRPALILAAVAVAAYLSDRFVHRKPILRRMPETAIAAALVGWAVLTVPFSYWPGGSVSLLLGSYLKALVIFWLLSHVIGTPRRLRQAAWGLTLMSVPLALSGIRNYLSGGFIAMTTMGEGPARIIGYEAPLTWNPNDLALMLNLILPLAVALFTIHRKAAVRVPLFLIILLDGVAVLVTFSRAGFLTLTAIVAVALWKFRRAWSPGGSAAVLAALLMILPLLPSSYLGRLGTILNIESDPTGSAQERWRDTVAATDFALEHPFVGAGLGMNILALNEERGSYWKSVHNVYLEYAVDLGFIGLALFVLLLGGCLRTARWAQRQAVTLGDDRELYALSVGIQISLVAFSIAGFFHPAAYHFYFYYMAGLAMALRGIYDNKKTDRHAVGQN